MSNSVDDGIRILQVDDDPSMLHISKIMLKDIESKFDIDTANSVDEAFQKLSSGRRYDLILSDFEMTLKSGLDFLRELKESAFKVPFILFTGKGREEIAIKALNLGADGYFNKQGDPETVYGELEYGIHKAIELSRAKKLVDEKEEKYSKAFNNSPYSVTITRLSDGKIIEANQAVFQLLGYASFEIIGKTTIGLNMWVNIDDRKEFTKELSEKKSVKNKVVLLRRKDGNQIIVNLSARASLIYVNNEKCFLAIVYDITEQKRRKSERSYCQNFSN